MVDIICGGLAIYVYLIFARILLGWFPLNPDGLWATVAGFLYLVTDPILEPLRRAIPTVRIGALALDISPFIVIFGAGLLQSQFCG